MKNITQPITPLKRHKLSFTVLMFFFFMFISNVIHAQGPSGVSISWSSEVGCQVLTELDSGHKDPITLEDIEDGNRIKVCELTTVVYTLSGNLGSSPNTVWNATGGMITYSTNSTCTINWGVSGLGEISFTLTTPTGVITKTIYIEKIIKPLAFFTVLPLQEQVATDYLEACVDQTINFTNLSTSNGGTGLIPPSFWEFGDGTFSTAFEPSHVYTHAGIYHVVLTVTNSCNCKTSYGIEIVVTDYVGFDIICPGVVCENQRATYTLPDEIKASCTGNYSWSVVGGEIANIDGDTGAVTVLWSNVDASGFGYLTFDPEACSAKCKSPSTLKIPVIQIHGTIQGDENVCLGSQVLYKLPQWPTTDIVWSIDGNATGTLAEVVLSQQRNEVMIRPLGLGMLTLRATYINTLLDCGGTAVFYINVGEPIAIAGDEVVCNFTTGNYHTVFGVPANWTLTNNAGVVVDTATYSSNYSFPFVTEGNYILTVGSSTNCPAQQLTISVTALPSSPLASTVEVLLTNGTLALASSLEVCPNAPYTYSIAAIPDPTVQYRWEVDAAVGTIIGSNIGNQVSISFTGVTPATLRVYKQSISPLVCSSLPLVVPIGIKQINAAISEDKSVVCANSNANYSAVLAGIVPEVAYTEGETYVWSITPNTLGSITAGQGTNAISILWNNTPTNIPATATLTLTIQKCTLPVVSFTKSITVNPLPIISIVATPTTFCSGLSITYSLDSTNMVPITSGVVTWDFGGTEVTSTIVAGDSDQPFTFSNFNASNIGKNVTAYITDANGCGGVTNTANLGVTVLPGPPAALSLPSQFNAFCTKFQIDATVTVASATAGVTYEWYKDGVLLSLPSTTTSLHIVYPTYTFGSYYFIAMNAAGCRTTSNPIQIIKYCPDEECVYTPLPSLINDSTQSCGLLNLIGSASGTPESVYWRIMGPPNLNIIHTGTSYPVTTAGDFHTYMTAEYLNSSGVLCVFNLYKKITVPYIPDFSYAPVCNGNNTFTVTVTDKTSFYAPVSNRSVTFSYRAGNSGLWIPVSGTLLPTLNAGVYQIRIVVFGDLNYETQPLCEKIIDFTLSAVPEQNIIIDTPPNCHDTAVQFSTENPQFGDSYLWTFEPGTLNEATNTQQFPKRVFPSSGTKIVKVVVTNRLGCSKEFTIDDLVIPEKCFNGTVTSSPNPPTVCAGSSVTLTYTPNGTECVPTQYVWMNGQSPITTAPNASSISVSGNGFYWVIVKKGICTYETPNRIVPLIKSLPSVRLELPSAVCIGEGVTVRAITTAPFLQWTVDGLPQPLYTNQLSFTRYGLTIGTHTIGLTVSSGDPALSTSCSTTVSQTVSVVMPPSEPQISQQIVCAGDDPNQPYYHVILTATSNVSGVFNWSNGDTGSTITVLDGGPYQVRVTNGGCSTTAQVDVLKNLEDYLWIFPSGCITSCIDKAGVPSIIGPRMPMYYWSWLFNGTDALSGSDTFPEPMVVANSGTYNLYLKTDQCGVSSAPLHFTADSECVKCPILEIGIQEIVINEESFCSFDIVLNVNANYDFIGTLVAPNDDFVVLPSPLNLTAGTNQITVTVIPLGTFAGGTVLFEFFGNDIEGKPCITQFPIDLPACSGEEGKFAKTEVGKPEYKTGSISISPNPAESEVFVRYDSLAAGSTIALFDLAGRALDNYTVSATEGTWALNTSSYPAGVYLVVVRSKGALVTQQKLIVK